MCILFFWHVLVGEILLPHVSRDGCLACLLPCCLDAACLLARLCLNAWLVAWLPGHLAWLPAWLPGWLAAWPGCLLGCLVDWPAWLTWLPAWVGAWCVAGCSGWLGGAACIGRRGASVSGRGARNQMGRLLPSARCALLPSSGRHVTWLPWPRGAAHPTHRRVSRGVGRLFE